jgi:hypothetical protein
VTKVPKAALTKFTRRNRRSSRNSTPLYPAERAAVWGKVIFVLATAATGRVPGRRTSWRLPPPSAAGAGA